MVLEGRSRRFSDRLHHDGCISEGLYLALSLHGNCRELCMRNTCPGNWHTRRTSTSVAREIHAKGASEGGCELPNGGGGGLGLPQEGLAIPRSPFLPRPRRCRGAGVGVVAHPRGLRGKRLLPGCLHMLRTIRSVTWMVWHFWHVSLGQPAGTWSTRANHFSSAATSSCI